MVLPSPGSELVIGHTLHLLAGEGQRGAQRSERLRLHGGWGHVHVQGVDAAFLVRGQFADHRQQWHPRLLLEFLRRAEAIIEQVLDVNDDRADTRAAKQAEHTDQREARRNGTVCRRGLAHDGHLHVRAFLFQIDVGDAVQQRIVEIPQTLLLVVHHLQFGHAVVQLDRLGFR